MKHPKKSFAVHFLKFTTILSLFKMQPIFEMVLFLLCVSLCSMNLFAQSIPDIGYYRSPSLQKITHKEIAELFREADVLILGEEHDDEAGHKEKGKLLESLSGLKLSLSLEMFETDQQIYLDEFGMGILDGKQLAKETRVWNNFERDYLPILQVAKNYSLPILGANAPRRYTRIASKGGLNSLIQLPESSKAFLPPLYLIKAYPQPEYESKFQSVMGGHGGEGMKNFFLAQELWDTSMSHTIANHISATGNKVVHINGRFHSDDGLGVTYRLKKMGFKVLTISMFPLRNSEPLETLSNTADILYISGNKITDTK